MAIFGGIVSFVKKLFTPTISQQQGLKNTLFKPMAQLMRKIGGTLSDIADTFDESGLAPASDQVRSLIHKAIEPLEHNLEWINLPNTSRPNSDMFSVQDLGRPNRYRYVVKVFYFDQERNALTDKFISFYSDDLKTLDELMSDYKQYDPLSESDTQ